MRYDPTSTAPAAVPWPVWLSMGWILALLWPLEIVRILTDLPGHVTAAASALFLLYLALALLSTGRGNRMLSLLLLAGIGTLSAIDGAWERALAGFGDAMIFAAFLPAVFLLRNAVSGDRRLLEYRRRLEALEPARQRGMVLMGSHILGSTLTVGAFAVLSPVVPASASAGHRREIALAAILGVGLSVIWSPVFVAMAVVSEFMPQVPLWKFVGVGMALSLVGMALAFRRIDVLGRLGLALEGVESLRAIVPWVLLTALVIVLLRSLTGLSTLEAASLTLPPLAAMLLVLQGRSRIGAALRETRASLDRLGAEISIVAWAFTLGAVMRASPSVEQAVRGVLEPGVPAALLVLGIVASMMLVVVLGGHPIVVASILLAVFASVETQLHDLTVGAAVLLGWGCSAMIAPAGLIVIVATGMFGVSRRSVILSRSSLAQVGFALVGVCMLTGLNWLLT